jgi:hypothetical protein
MPLSATCLQRGDGANLSEAAWGVEYLPGQSTHNLVGNFTYSTYLLTVQYMYCMHGAAT